MKEGVGGEKERPGVFYVYVSGVQRVHLYLFFLMFLVLDSLYLLLLVPSAFASL